MSIKDILVDRSVQAAPSASYLSALLAGVSIPTVVSVLTGIYVSLQIYKAVLDIRAAKRKEKLQCKVSETD